jgi:hypothetical protein
MNTTHNLKKMIVGALLSGGVAVAALGLAAGAAQAEVPYHWCPGDDWQANWDTHWDPADCHSNHHIDLDGTTGVFDFWGPPGVVEPPWHPRCPPIAFMCP